MNGAGGTGSYVYEYMSPSPMMRYTTSQNMMGDYATQANSPQGYSMPQYQCMYQSITQPQSQQGQQYCTYEYNQLGQGNGQNVQMLQNAAAQSQQQQQQQRQQQLQMMQQQSPQYTQYSNENDSYNSYPVAYSVQQMPQSQETYDPRSAFLQQMSQQNQAGMNRMQAEQEQQQQVPKTRDEKIAMEMQKLQVAHEHQKAVQRQYYMNRNSSSITYTKNRVMNVPYGMPMNVRYQ